MEYLSFSSSLTASRMLVEFTVKISNHHTHFSARNGEISLKQHLLILNFPIFLFYICQLFPKLMIELKKFISKKLSIFLIFQFGTLFIDLPLFAFGKYFYRLLRVSALLWSGGSIIVNKNWKFRKFRVIFSLYRVIQNNLEKIQRLVWIILNSVFFGISSNYSTVFLKTRPKCGQIQRKFQRKFRDIFPPRCLSRFHLFTLLPIGSQFPSGRRHI